MDWILERHKERVLCCLNLNVRARKNTMSGPYYEWYTTNTMVFLSSDHDLLKPCRRDNILLIPFGAFSTANVHVPPPSPPPPRWRRCSSCLEMNLFCNNIRMKFASQFYNQLTLPSVNHLINMELLQLIPTNTQWLQGWISSGVYLNINVMCQRKRGKLSRSR